jgi:hypothetical protein
MVPPVFWNKMAYFYTSGTQVDMNAKLLAYEWSDIQNAFELKCSKDMSQETSQSLYHKYTMINAGDDGIIFKENGGTDFLRYMCNPDTKTWDVDATTQTVDLNSLLCGAASTASVTAMTLL